MPKVRNITKPIGSDKLDIRLVQSANRYLYCRDWLSVSLADYLKSTRPRVSRAVDILKLLCLHLAELGRSDFYPLTGNLNKLLIDDEGEVHYGELGFLISLDDELFLHRDLHGDLLSFPGREASAFALSSAALAILAYKFCTGEKLFEQAQILQLTREDLDLREAVPQGITLWIQQLYKGGFKDFFEASEALNNLDEFGVEPVPMSAIEQQAALNLLCDSQDEEFESPAPQLKRKTKRGKKSRRISSSTREVQTKRKTRSRQPKKSSALPLILIIFVVGLASGGFWFWRSQNESARIALSDSAKEQSPITQTTRVNEAKEVSPDLQEVALPAKLEKTYLRKIRQPNIIFVVAHHMSIDWLSSYGGVGGLSPNVDRLAENGLLFKTAWMNPESSSSHASILSGQYPFRHKVFNTSRSGASFQGEKTWPSLLKRQSYATAFSGRWPFPNLASLTPAKIGFETYCHTSRKGGVNLNGSLREAADPIKATADFSVDFIKANKSKPFMLYYTVPYEAKQGMEASVRKMDACLGRIQRTLIQEGLQQKTIIIFTSDGASAQAGSMDFNLSKLPIGIKKPGQLPRSLNQLTNMGAQVPLIVSAPFLIPKMGYFTQDLVDSSDFFPTIADLCGLRGNTKLDGRSCVPTLEGNLNPLKKRSWLFSQSSKGKMIRDWEYIYYSDKEFYGLKYDPLQNHNLNKTRHNDKRAPNGRNRLKMLMDRLGS